MRKLFLISVVILSLALQGCPILTQYPIDNGSYTANKWLLGKWKLMPEVGNKGFLFENRKDSKSKMTVYQIDSSGQKDEGRLVILSSVGEKIFFNAYDSGKKESGDEPGYYIYLLKKNSEQQFDLIPVSEKNSNLSYESPADTIKNRLATKKLDQLLDLNETEHYIKK